MPRFKEFAAPDKAFSEDATGFAAFETAGRRVGPQYREAGQDLRQAGEAGVRAARASQELYDAQDRLAQGNIRVAEDQERVQRQEDRQRISNLTWPYDMLALSQQSRSSRGGGGGGGMRLAGSVNPEIDNRTGGYANDSSSGGRGSSPARMSHAAAGLGQLASGLAQRAPYAARTDITNGQVTYDSRNPRAYQQPTSYLEGGQLVHQGQRPTRGSFGLTQGEQQELDRYGNGAHNAGPFDTSTGQPMGGEAAGEAAGDQGYNQPRNFQELQDQLAPNQSSGWWSGIANSIGSAFGSGGSGADQGSSDEYGEE